MIVLLLQLLLSRVHVSLLCWCLQVRPPQPPPLVNGVQCPDNNIITLDPSQGVVNLFDFQAPDTTYLLKPGTFSLTAPIQVTGNSGLCYVQMGVGDRTVTRTSVVISPSSTGTFRVEAGSTLGLRSLTIQGSSGVALTTENVLSIDGRTLLMQDVALRNLQSASLITKQLPAKAGPAAVITVQNSNAVITDTLLEDVTGGAGVLSCGSDNPALSPSQVPLQQVRQSVITQIDVFVSVSVCVCGHVCVCAGAVVTLSVT